MRFWLKRFVKSDDGAVMLDWVMLSACIIPIAIAMGLMIGSALNSFSGETAADLSSAQVTLSAF